MSQVTGNIQTSQLVRGSGDFRSDSGSPSGRPLLGQEGGSETPLTHPTAPSLLGQPKRMGERLRFPTRRPPLGRPAGEAVVGWERSPLSHQPASSRPGQPERGREGWRESPLLHPPSSFRTLWQPERQREGGSSPHPPTPSREAVGGWERLGSPSRHEGYLSKAIFQYFLCESFQPERLNEYWRRSKFLGTIFPGHVVLQLLALIQYILLLETNKTILK